MYTDLLDAISDIIFEPVDLFMIDDQIVSDRDQIKDLIHYINQEVRVVFVLLPVLIAG